MAELPRISSLTALDLSWCVELVDSCLSPLKNCCGLKVLNLAGCSKITSAGAQIIADISTLTALNLYQCKSIGNGEGVGVISHLTGLTTLNLGDCGIADVSVLQLTRLTNLTSIDLSQSDIGEVALATLLRTARSLNEVYLYNCRWISGKCLKELSRKFLNGKGQGKVNFQMRSQNTLVIDTRLKFMYPQFFWRPDRFSGKVVRH